MKRKIGSLTELEDLITLNIDQCNTKNQLNTKIGIVAKDVDNWKDIPTMQEYYEAIQQAYKQIEDKLINAALRKDSNYNANFIAFLLRSQFGYTETQNLNTNITNPISINFKIDPEDLPEDE